MAKTSKNFREKLEKVIPCSVSGEKQNRNGHMHQILDHEHGHAAHEDQIRDIDSLFDDRNIQIVIQFDFATSKAKLMTFLNN